MATGRFKKLILGTGITGTDNGDDSITLEAAGSSVDVATDAIWDTKGDLAVASGADAANNLPVGSNDQVLVADSGETLGVRWADIDAVPGGSDWDSSIVKGSDESVSSSTVLQSDDALTFTATSGTVYFFEAIVVYASPAGAGTPDLRIGFGEDVSARGVVNGIAYYSAGNAATTSVAETTQAANFICGTATGNRIAIFRGWHLGGGGTFAMVWCQNVSGANATIVRAGSILRYKAFT